LLAAQVKGVVVLAAVTALVFELAAANESADPAFVCLVVGEEGVEENGQDPDLRHLETDLKH